MGKGRNHSKETPRQAVSLAYHILGSLLISKAIAVIV